MDIVLILGQTKKKTVKKNYYWKCPEIKTGYQQINQIKEISHHTIKT